LRFVLAQLMKLCVLIFGGELASLVESGTRFDLPWFQGGVWSFVIEKPCVLVAALLSFERGICHPYGLV
jgi:hypothetical protein